MFHRIIEACRLKRYSDGKRYSFGRNMNRVGWVLKAQFGPGAGYCQYRDHTSNKVDYYGRTAFIAYKSGSWQYAKLYRDRRNAHINRFAWITGIEIGITRNGNRAPYTAH